MELKEALNVLSQVVENYFTGLPKDQRVVQQALQAVAKVVQPEIECEKEKELNGNK